MHTYLVDEERILDENGKETAVYGIQVMDENTLVETVRNVFCRYEDACAFVNLCNKSGLSYLHLSEAIEDEINRISM